MKPRVLILSQAIHCIPPLTGAAVEQWIDAVAHRLADWEPHIVSVPHPSRPDDENDGVVSYHRIRIGRVYRRVFQKLTRLDPWPYIRRVVAHAHTLRPDLIHVHNAPQYVAALRAGLPGVPLLLHMHNEKKIAHPVRVDALAGCSAYIAHWFQAQGAPANRFAVLPNGVDATKFFPQAERRAMLARRHSLPLDRFVISYVGRISPEKGLDTLVEAFAHLPPERFHLVVAGEWPKGNQGQNERVAYADKLRAVLPHLSATILGDFPPTDMPDIYQLGDLLVIPSRFEEPFSMVAIEAMASGLPVLALRRGGMAEYMRHGENAYVVDPQASPEQLAGAILACAADPAGNQARALAARRMVEQRFSWTQVAQQTEALYAQLADARREG